MHYAISVHRGIALPWLLGHRSDINHPLISFGGTPSPKPASPRKLHDSRLPPSLSRRVQPLFPPGEIIPCPSCTLISRRRTTALLDRRRVPWKRLWKRVLVERCFLSSRRPKITFDILDISRNAPEKLIPALALHTAPQ